MTANHALQRNRSSRFWLQCTLAVDRVAGLVWLGRDTHHERNYVMNKKVITREGLIFLAPCGAFVLLAVVLWLLGITLWPLLAFAPLAPLVIAFYVFVRWRLRERRCHS
jgi:hypothetical protein